MKKANRKLQAAWVLTALTTIMLVIPTLASSVSVTVGVGFAWVLIGEATWAATISLVWAAYFGANVAEKHNSMVPDHQYNADYDMSNTVVIVNPDEPDLDGDLF